MNENQEAKERIRSRTNMRRDILVEEDPKVAAVIRNETKRLREAKKPLNAIRNDERFLIRKSLIESNKLGLASWPSWPTKVTMLSFARVQPMCASYSPWLYLISMAACSASVRGEFLDLSSRFRRHASRDLLDSNETFSYDTAQSQPETSQSTFLSSSVTAINQGSYSVNRLRLLSSVR
jgi:hypothetical protein